MNSKERTRRAFLHKTTDKTPSAFGAVSSVIERLQKELNAPSYDVLLDKLEIDIRSVSPKYIGPELKEYKDKDGNIVRQSYFGHESTLHWNGHEYNGVTTKYPLAHMETVSELDQYKFPDPDWFDYKSIANDLIKYEDRAIIVGHPGPFQIVCNLVPMEKLFMDMAINPDFAHAVYDRMVEFELAYYERLLIAGNGQIDILRPHDDYGTQISLLFSVEMWKDYFKENTKKLVNLAHKYNAFYLQHSCGSVSEIIPELIDCGVDGLEPIQKVKGMEIEILKEKYGKDLLFHGGIDTQYILPKGSKEEVYTETKRFLDLFGNDGGYILMGSQGFEGDIPTENILSLYSARN